MRQTDISPSAGFSDSITASLEYTTHVSLFENVKETKIFLTAA